MSSADVERRAIRAGDLEMSVLLAGPPAGDLVVLVHGFPELAHSWRHQLAALGAAGYRCAAPDVRGTGGTQAPPRVEDYDAAALTGDVVALIDALGADTAVVIGHDTGADT